MPLLAVLLVACAQLPVSDTGDAPLATPIITAIIGTPSPTPTLAASPAATPAPTAPATATRLTLCTGAEPASLASPDDVSYAAQLVRAAIYDGPIDTVAYRQQPVLLEKVPSLADGDALIAPVPVREGDLVLNAVGEAMRLAPGVTVRPANCRTSGCAVTVSAADLAPNTPMPFAMDQMTVTFVLKAAGWRWPNGTPLTASDSVRAFEAAETDVSGVRASLKPGTARYAALDDRHVVWVGLPGFLPATYDQAFWTPQSPTLDQVATRDEVAPRDQDAADLPVGYGPLPVGYGPYTPAGWNLGEALRLYRNMHYRAPDGTVPVFDEIWVRFWPGSDRSLSESGVLDALVEGDCDLLTPDLNLVRALPRLEAMAQAGTVRLITQPSGAWEHLTFNLNATPPLFADVRTRQAVAYCLDRDVVMSEATHGYGVVLDTYLPPEHPLAQPVEPYAYIPDRGVALLSQVGWIDNDGDGLRESVAVAGIPDGTPLRVRYLTTTAAAVDPSTGRGGTDRESVAQQVAAMLNVCGIGVEVLALPPWEFYAQHADSPLISGEFDLAQLAWPTELIPACDLYMTGAIPTPPPVIKPLSAPSTPHAVTDTSVIESPVIRYGWTGTNIGGFSDVAYDAVCSQAIWSLPGEPGYESAHRRAQQIFSKLLPALPLYRDVTYLAAHPALEGVIPDPVAAVTWNVERFK